MLSEMPSSDAPAVSEEAVGERESSSAIVGYDHLENSTAEEREEEATETVPEHTTISNVGEGRASRDPTPPQLPNLAAAALQRLAAAAAAVLDDSTDDFQPVKKRRRLQEDGKEKQEEGDGEDSEVLWPLSCVLLATDTRVIFLQGQMCSICFEPWSNSGGHRLASLKCGHLFGLKYLTHSASCCNFISLSLLSLSLSLSLSLLFCSCIEKWLKGQGERCPQCNAKARKVDIRVIFAKSLSAVDTTERDRALKVSERER